MEERIIVSLTTWTKRICNIPVVLDSIFTQSIPPDFVVLNLAYDEEIPKEVKNYLELHKVEVNRVEDTKVYKKLIPTLQLYPDDCIISIDDDWIYPDGMIADFLNIHRKYPDFPISGNREVINGWQCHCGCASLTKACYFGDLLKQIDCDLRNNCPSDDIVYTYLATAAGHPYIRTQNMYFSNMQPYNADDSYSFAMVDNANGINNSIKYLECRFGSLNNPYCAYINDSYISVILDSILQITIKKQTKKAEASRLAYEQLLSSDTFRIGKAITYPLRWLKKLFV